MEFVKIGKVSLLLAMAEETEAEHFRKKAEQNGFAVCLGQAGSMDFKKIVAAIETAAIREKLIADRYWERHALYHCILEAFHGVGRGQLELGSVMRTVGVRFAAVRGKRNCHVKEDGDWLVVALYGTMGAPIKGCEHEVVGLGTNHI